MCARGMDAGINGDFEYLINESSKPAFEPSYFSRVSLSLSLSVFFVLFSSFLYISFFFSPQRERISYGVDIFVSLRIFGRAFRFIRVVV